MDAQAATGVYGAISAVSLSLSTVSWIAAACAWFFSRAEKVRAFETQIAQHVLNLKGRVEAVEAKALDQYVALEGVADEARGLFERVTKERKRLTQENVRADKRENGGDGAPDLTGLSRADQVAAVRAQFGGM